MKLPIRLPWRHRPEYAVGIDFGTTKTAVAYAGVDNMDALGWVEPGGRCQWSFSSCIAVKQLKEDCFTCYIGEDLEKKNLDFIREPSAQVAHGLFDRVKLHLGQGGFEEETLPAELLEKFPHLKAHPEYLAANILGYAHRKAAAQLADKATFDSVTITIPSSWDPEQRRATKFAALLAGFQNVELLEEPIAALEYLLAQPTLSQLPGPTCHIVVVDFGGGTCDIAVVRIERSRKGQAVYLLATVGDKLGGEMVDDLLYEEFGKFLREQENIDIDKIDVSCRRNIRMALEEFKREINERARNYSPGDSRAESVVSGWMYESFSSSGEYSKPIPIGGNSQKEWGMNVDRFKKLLEEEQTQRKGEEIYSFSQVFAKLIESTKEYLPEGKVDQVVLVGGSSQLFFVKRTVAGILCGGNEDLVYLVNNPDRVVSLGAAIHQRRRILSQRRFTPSLPYSIGLYARPNHFETIVEGQKQLKRGIKARRVCTLLYESPVEEPLILAIKPGGHNIARPREIQKRVRHSNPIKRGYKIVLTVKVAVDGIVAFSIDRHSPEDNRFEVEEDYPLCEKEGFEARREDFEQKFPAAQAERDG